MHEITRNFGEFFKMFEIIEFQIDSRNEKVDFDFIELELSLQEVVLKFEKELQIIYLEGSDLVLKRVRRELLQMQKTLKQKLNIGVNFRFEESGQKYTLEPEVIDSIHDLKLRYTSRLIVLIDYFLEHQQTEIDATQEVLSFTNTFDNVSPIEIYKHFKSGLSDKGYFPQSELNEFLKAAFELKTIPETLFKIKDAPKKATIEAVFYRYYKNVAGKIHGKQKQYAALLGDYFEGYKTTTVSSNFSKSVY
jgi:hypothetical protein